jgi:hypothetical protein
MFCRSLAAAFLLLASSAMAQEGDLADALERGEPGAVQRMLDAGLPAAEQRLAEGALAGMLNRDADAGELLSAAMLDDALDRDLRRRAA